MRYVLPIIAALSCAACADSTATDEPAASGKPKAEKRASSSAQAAAGSGAEKPSSSERDETQPSAAASAMKPEAQPGDTAAKPAQNPSAPAAKSSDGLAMDECGLKTQFAGDEYCIKPPPEDKGFQMHLGPSDYEKPGAEYLMQAGEENVVSMTQVSGNKKDVHYYYRQYRMRPGSHHVIISASSGGGSAGFGGRRLGGTQNLAKDNPDKGVIPPENEGVGMPLAADTTLSANMHFYNFTDKPIIREIWVNFWYKDPATVKESASEIFSMTGVRAAVAHSHVVVGAKCPISAEGRILSMYGHRHLNNVRFSAWRERGTQRELILEDFDSEHPTVLEYNSIATNPMSDAATKKAGGWSGVLDLMPGDSISFECEIVNKSDKNFSGQNEANDDEMCILVGDTAGTQIPFGCTASTAKTVAASTD
ncbi:MAG TPA: hypothetical protein VJV78_43655 [Polyangiales bacterium]|nr:hypothetical protein [Polyangiales bacterium]